MGGLKPKPNKNNKNSSSFQFLLSNNWTKANYQLLAKFHFMARALICTFIWDEEERKKWGFSARLLALRCQSDNGIVLSTCRHRRCFPALPQWIPLTQQPQNIKAHSTFKHGQWQECLWLSGEWLDPQKDTYCRWQKCWEFLGGHPKLKHFWERSAAMDLDSIKQGINGIQLLGRCGKAAPGSCLQAEPQNER